MRLFCFTLYWIAIKQPLITISQRSGQVALIYYNYWFKNLSTHGDSIGDRANATSPRYRRAIIARLGNRNAAARLLIRPHDRAAGADVARRQHHRLAGAKGRRAARRNDRGGCRGRARHGDGIGHGASATSARYRRAIVPRLGNHDAAARLLIRPHDRAAGTDVARRQRHRLAGAKGRGAARRNDRSRCHGRARHGDGIGHGANATSARYRRAVIARLGNHDAAARLLIRPRDRAAGADVARRQRHRLAGAKGRGAARGNDGSGCHGGIGHGNSIGDGANAASARYRRAVIARLRNRNAAARLLI